MFSCDWHNQWSHDCITGVMMYFTVLKNRKVSIKCSCVVGLDLVDASMEKVTLLTFFLCRRRWRRVRPGSLRWSFSSSSSKLSSWRGWKMQQQGPSWENLSTCYSPLWLSFWSLSPLWPIVWSPWWRHALAPSRPSCSSSYWPSCGETGTLSLDTRTVLCSPQDDQIEPRSVLLMPGDVTVAAVQLEAWRMCLLLMAVWPSTENSAEHFWTQPGIKMKWKKPSPAENVLFYSRRMRLFTF